MPSACETLKSNLTQTNGTFSALQDRSCSRMESQWRSATQLFTFSGSCAEAAVERNGGRTLKWSHFKQSGFRKKKSLDFNKKGERKHCTHRNDFLCGNISSLSRGLDLPWFVFRRSRTETRSSRMYLNTSFYPLRLQQSHMDSTALTPADSILNCTLSLERK